jgi:hypothetical protein
MGTDRCRATSIKIRIETLKVSTICRKKCAYVKGGENAPCENRGIIYKDTTWCNLDGCNGWEIGCPGWIEDD